MINILSIDIGIKNLAYCIKEFDTTSGYFKIIKWDIINLCSVIPNCYKLDNIRDWDESRVTNSDEEVVVSHNWDEIRRFMWDYVGIVRTTKRLQRAHHRIKLLKSEINEYYGNFRITKDLIELNFFLHLLN